MEAHEFRALEDAWTASSASSTTDACTVATTELPWAGFVIRWVCFDVEFTHLPPM